VRSGGDHSVSSFRLARYLCALVVASFGLAAAVAQPANDRFADRTVISEGAAGVWGSLSNATSEIGEPVIPGVSSGQTAWWSWTAPSNGILTLSVTGMGFSPLLTAYTGNDLSALSLIASNNYIACYESTVCGCHERLRSGITFHVARGQSYAIAVDSAIVTDALWVYQVLPHTNWLGQDDSWLFAHWVATQTTNVPAGSDIQLGVQFTPAPTNDDFENPVIISGVRTRAAASNVGATKQPGEPDHSGNSGGSSVWYSWTAPASGRVTLSTNEIPPYLPPSWWGSFGWSSSTGWWNPQPTCGKEIDLNPPPPFFPLFAAYTGSAVNALASPNCLPLSLTAYPHAVAFDAVRGQTYRIAFDGNLGTTGDLTLFLALTQPALNDDFANRIKVRGVYVVATGYNAGATHEAGEPPPVSVSQGKSIWWSWTSPANGTTTINLGGSDYDWLPISVFTGASLSDLQLVATGFGGGSLGETSFEAVAGQTYQISVSDYEGLTGAIRMNLQAPIVELPLARTIQRSARKAILNYTATAGQVVLFQSCAQAGAPWKDVRTVTARKPVVSFTASPAPAYYGPYYRAIVVDRSSR
jgi:hypothetical protein